MKTKTLKKTKRKPVTRVGSGTLVMPHERTIRHRLKELRKQIDTSKDPAVQRISYAMETAITWAREKTVGWEAPAIIARDLATMLHRELKDLMRHNAGLTRAGK